MNFHPCDGYYLNAEYNLTLRYALPVPAGALGGVPFETLASGLAPFSDLEIATVDVPFILGFTAPVRGGGGGGGAPVARSRRGRSSTSWLCRRCTWQSRPY